MTSSLPPPTPLPPPPPLSPAEQQGPQRFFAAASDAPMALRPVVVLLAVNLAISVTLTVATLIIRHSIVDYQLDHRHVTDPALRQTLRNTYTDAIVIRAFVNVVVSIIYVFLIRALFRGRRWAYRRVVLIGAAGIVGLAVLQFTPYPPWMRVEQGLQAIVLAALLWFVLRPDVRNHFAKGLPGRDQRRFRRQ